MSLFRSDLYCIRSDIIRELTPLDSDYSESLADHLRTRFDFVHGASSVGTVYAIISRFSRKPMNWPFESDGRDSQMRAM